jgi:hypothetical protein
MATVTTARSKADGKQTGAPLRLAPSRQRRPGLVVAGALLTVACGFAGAVAYLHAGSRTEVLALAQPVAQGQSITASDLQAASISASSPLRPIPASDEAQIIGRRATVPLVAGSLLTQAELSAGPSIPSGQAVVGVALKAGQLPAAGLQPGDPVMVVLTPPSGASIQPGAAANSVLVPNALVTANQPPPANSSYVTLVSVQVPANLAASLTSAAAAGQVSLALLPSS